MKCNLLYMLHDHLSSSEETLSWVIENKFFDLNERLSHAHMPFCDHITYHNNTPLYSLLATASLISLGQKDTLRFFKEMVFAGANPNQVMYFFGLQRYSTLSYCIVTKAYSCAEFLLENGLFDPAFIVDRKTGETAFQNLLVLKDPQALKMI